MNKNNKHDFGMIGLGTMGSNLLQNIADNGYSCSGYDINHKMVEKLNQLGRDQIKGFNELEDFAQSLKSPRIVMLLVPAGQIVDNVLKELMEVLDKGDIIIDGGNSHFIDTDRRYKELEKDGFHFIGMGVSGGEEGARRGPSMMPGGDKKAYEKIAPILKKAAADVNGEPTVAYMGKGSSGHFVKMVHNGIEYAIMQLISETYEVLKYGLLKSDPDIHEIFKRWNEGRLESYLIDITRDIFAYKNQQGEHLLLNDIRDEARAKGTGKWTCQEARNLNLPIPIIDIAVSMRDLSKYKDLRIKASKLYSGTSDLNYKNPDPQYIEILEEAYYFAMVTAYTQGMHLLYMANNEYGYDLNLHLIAKIWRGGCIIRSAFLEDIYAAYQNDPNLEHLFLEDSIQSTITKSIPGIRKVVSDAVTHGISVPAFSSAISYFDNFRRDNMPTNLIQAQRDYFGSHTYELRSKEGFFHTEWQEANN